MTEEVALDGRIDDAAEAPKAKRKTDWGAELRGLFWLILAVLGFHSLIAKPFYIPSESMLPGLLVGDRLVVTKYPYGYSYITPTFHVLPFMQGRLFGRMPERGDVVIVTPPGDQRKGEDWIKRVIGLPGDTIEVRDGVVFINGTAVKRGPLHYATIRDYGDAQQPSDPKLTCDAGDYGFEARVKGAAGRTDCRLPLITETLPNGRTYETVELGRSQGDFFEAVKVPAGHVFLMGDNRDRSADSRFTLEGGGLGGPVPWENLGGRAEFVTFSVDGSATWNPLTWFTQFRGDRTGVSLHAPREKP